jgi:hypothetical protein
VKSSDPAVAAKRVRGIAVGSGEITLMTPCTARAPWSAVPGPRRTSIAAACEVLASKSWLTLQKPTDGEQALLAAAALHQHAGDAVEGFGGVAAVDHPRDAGADAREARADAGERLGPSLRRDRDLVQQALRARRHQRRRGDEREERDVGAAGERAGHPRIIPDPAGTGILMACVWSYFCCP